MTRQQIEDLIRFARTLQAIAHQLEGWETIDEDQSWLRDSRTPPTRLDYSPQHAIDNCQALGDLIHAAGQLTAKLPGDPLICDARAVLVMAHDTIADAAVPAEMALNAGEDEESTGIIKESLARACERCSNPLETLAAKLLVWADDECRLYNQGRGADDQRQDREKRPQHRVPRCAQDVANREVWAYKNSRTAIYKKAQQGDKAALKQFTANAIAEAITKKLHSERCDADQVKRSPAWSHIRQELGTGRGQAPTLAPRRNVLRPDFDIHDICDEQDLEGNQ